MSVQHANIGIVKKDLQLYYNREYLKSFKGEATGNIAYTTNNYLNSNGNWWTNSGSTIFNDNDTSIAKPVIINVDTTDLRVFSSTVTAVGDQQLGSSIIPISGSTQYTMSIYCWFSGTSMAAQPYLRTYINNNSLGNFAYNGDTNYLNWPKNTWIRLSITFITPSNETGVYMSSYTGNNVGEKLAYFGYQLEQKSYSTPLVLGSRAETVTNLYSADPYDGFDFVTVYNYVGSTGATISVDTISNPINAPTVLKYTTGSGGYVYFALTKTGLASGTYTVSYYARLESGGPSALNNQQLWRDNVTDLSVQGDWNPTFYTYWKRFRTTASVTSGTLHFFPIHSGALTGGFTVYYTGFQLESGDRAKSFTPSSVTANTVASGGGLLDISGNNYSTDLNSSGISFDANGFSFTGDYAGAITIPTSGSILDSLSNNTHSYEVWFKLLGTPPGASDGYFFGRQGNHEGFAHFKSTPATFGCLTWYNDNSNSGWLSYAGSLNTWYHAVYVVNVESSARQLYVNGVLHSSGILTAQLKQYVTGPSYYCYFGSANPSYSSNITLSSAKAYNRALTAAEILQNFNATRKTYGI